MPAAQSNRRSAPSRTMRARSSPPLTGIRCSPSGIGVPSNDAATAASSLSVPSPVRGSIATTGTPSSARDNAAGSISSPWRRARSFMDRATTTGRPSSSTPARKYRDRTRLVASSTATSASGASMPSIPAAACAATRSSGDCGSSENVPGVSRISQIPADRSGTPGLPVMSSRPRSTSTVVPGAFITRAPAPSSTLNSVDLPTLGLPTNTTRRAVSPVTVCPPPAP